ncbi:peptidoglycan bridge formation glycyltransferase FemA/FemB family protein [Microbacteriaceae bacterium]|nr:peptidoglycan bridge formation glycyltransferase FemA/FemB family protein [Candidatus Saccharibacteria bacterium]
MNVRYANEDEIKRWDELLVANADGGNVFQSTEVAETKRKNGWTPRYVILEDMAITVLEKSVPLLGNYWYLPKGPGVHDISNLKAAVESLKPFAADNSVFCIKIEPELLDDPSIHESLTNIGLHKTPPVQPNASTVLIDLSSSVDEIMAGLNQKGRHAIRRGERDGVTTKAVDLTDGSMRQMFDLLNETAAGRFESSVRPFEYYKKFWTSLAKNGHGQLFFAYVDQHLVAGAFCMLLGTKGLYKDGASVRERTVYGASHLLQWHAIHWMKAHGALVYDFCGAPHSSVIGDESHPFYGIGRFKTSFNKHVTDYIGCYDIPVNTTKYAIWQKIGQRLAVSLSYRIKHRQWF